MKLVVWEAPDSPAAPGVLTERGVVGLAELPGEVYSSQAAMERLIDRFASLRPRLEALAESGAAVPLESVRLLPPLPRPGKILCSTASYRAAPGAAAPLLMTLKSSESVVG